MKFTFILLLTFGFNIVHASYCIFDGNQRKSCFSSLYACKDVLAHVRAGMSRNDECRQYEIKNTTAPELSASAPNAFCLWVAHKGAFKNLGCMEKSICDYSMTKYPETVCAKGNLKDQGSIRKLYLARDKMIRAGEQAAKAKQDKEANEIYARGNEREISEYIATKSGNLKITSQADVAAAQKRLEPFCLNGNAHSCYVLSDLYDLSSFKSEWKRSEDERCADHRKYYEFLTKSCVLGFTEACKHMISKENIRDGTMSPNHATDGTYCEIPLVSDEVDKIRSKCIRKGVGKEMCK